MTIKTGLSSSPLMGSAMLSGLLLPFGALWLGRRRRLLALLAALAVMMVLSLAACGGKEENRTPAGSYDVVVKATASGSTQGSTSIRLNVR